MIINSMTLKVGEATFDLIGFEIKEGQMPDRGNEKPTGLPRVMKFWVHFESNGNKAVHQALKDPTKSFEGSIDFISGGGLTDQIVFNDPTYCIEHKIIANAPDAQTTGSLTEEAVFVTNSNSITW